ncbi:MAG: SDR family oxidoreductase [Chloroflexota bacterium]|nr:SDR family oxidoreductase [Chloroflexota bacterium]
MKINVLGGTGQLGSRIIDSLLRAGARPEQLVISCRNEAKARRFAELGIEIRYADYDVPESLAPAFDDTDVLMQIPSMAPVEDRVIEHDRILAGAKSASVRRIVFSSFSAARTDSLFLIAPYLVYAETKVRLCGIDWTILRNGMYLDPLADWAPELVKQGRLPYPVQSGRVAYISRDDLARASASALMQDGHSGQVYELTGPEAVSMPQLAGALTAATGTPIAFDCVSESEFEAICRKDDIPDEIVAILASMYRAVDHGEFARVTDHVELLSGAPAESVEAHLQRAIGVPGG